MKKYTTIGAMRVFESRDTWNGIPVRQFDFLMTEEASPTDLGEGNVRVLVSARRNCAPHVKWVFSGTKRKGWATAAYRWLVEHFNQPLKVSDVCGPESIEFHDAMKTLGLVASYSIDPVFQPSQPTQRNIKPTGSLDP